MNASKYRKNFITNFLLLKKLLKFCKYCMKYNACGGDSRGHTL